MWAWKNEQNDQKWFEKIYRQLESVIREKNWAKCEHEQ